MGPVRTGDENPGRAERMVNAEQRIEYVARGAEYRKSGWNQFDEKAEPYKPSSAELERIRRKWPDAAE